ncbi:TetR/AcrR family transcriptional regulator [Planotetraspora sp. GP83]|uniref:TetR/AcrR family transcriptional regulator n=1 Tax=Planotetraspora sp. GP83 TaxID=3156264 RepID=UPI003517CFE8
MADHDDGRARIPRRPGRPGADGPPVPDEEEILRGGLDAFADLGYDGTSVRELARRLGVSHNFINDRYGSKGRFWRAVVDFALAEMNKQLVPAVESQDDDVDRMVAGVTHFYRLAARASQLNRLMADESVRESDRLDYLYEHYLGPSLAALAPSVDRLIKAGRIPPISMHLLYFAVTGPVIAMTRHPLAERLGGPSREDAQQVTADAETLAEVVLNGLLRPAPR